MSLQNVLIVTYNHIEGGYGRVKVEIGGGWAWRGARGVGKGWGRVVGESGVRGWGDKREKSSFM